MGEKKIFAADLGASGGKCFVGTFNEDEFSFLETHRFSHESVCFFITDGSGTVSERMYWDDTLLYQNIIRGLCAYRREISDTLDSIGIDTWGTDGSLISADGDILGKVYCYRDHRLDGMIEATREKIDAEKIYGITGIHFQPFNISNQLLWLVQNRSDLLSKVSMFLPMPTLFYYYLGNVKRIDSSWASVTQLMNARTKEWSDEILAALGFPKALLPEIVPPGLVIGHIHERLAEKVGLNRARLVSVGSHDTASAYAAAPVENPDEALIISSGTWSLVGKLIPEPITSPQTMAMNISNEGGIGNIRFLKNCMGMWIAQELRRLWRIRDGKEMSWEEITRRLKRARPFHVFINPDDQGFYNPPDMEEAIAKFCKKSAQPVLTDRGAILRCVYESLAMKYREVNEQVSGACERPTSVIHIVGGGCKNELLNQFTADATGLPVVAGPDEATAVGNIMVQAMGLGIIKDLSVTAPMIKKTFPIREYSPRHTAEWQREYERYRGLS
jgi:rhamnulokinase